MIGIENPIKSFSSCYGPNGIIDGDMGGTTNDGDCNSWHAEVWALLTEKFDVKSFLDIGCGVGMAQSFFEKNGIENIGFDGTDAVLPYHKVPNRFIKHDLTQGPFCSRYVMDFVWSCDVFEHIEEQYVKNILETAILCCGKVLAFSAAPKGWGGHHHVNCQDVDYWVKKFEDTQCFKYDQELTIECRLATPPFENGRGESYFYRSGLVFSRI